MQDLYQSLPWRQLVSTPVLVHCTNPVALGTVLRQRIQWLELKGRLLGQLWDCTACVSGWVGAHSYSWLCVAKLRGPTQKESARFQHHWASALHGESSFIVAFVRAEHW